MPFLEPDIERALLRAYIDSANDGIFVLCDEMKFHVANPVLAQWLGMSEAELTAHGQRIPITDLFGSAATASQFRHQFAAAAQGQAVRFEVEIRPPRGDTRWVEIGMNRVHLEDGELVIGIVRDTTEQKMLQTALQHLASHDDLTGLFNRRAFRQRLRTLVNAQHAGAVPHALLYVDLDQFKVVNDTCGHAAGDELLHQIGMRLKKLAGSADLVARLGGDEFGLLLHDRPIEEAMKVARSLCEDVAAHRFTWDGRPFEITASVGVCAINRDIPSAEEALSAADAACHVAKDQGRNRAQLYSEGAASKDKRQEMAWVARLQKALEENRFQIWHQRILGLRDTGDADGVHVEMLLRLVDENGEIVAPARFFPAAERYGLMPAIDRWVIQHLLLGGECGRPHQGMPAHCAINLSGASLNDDRFLVFLEDALRRTTIPTTALCFEITETVAVANFARVREVMQRLQNFGCRFALDDFGSGMSSFSYLKNLPVDSLKIDGALVRNIVEDAADLTMVEAIARIGRALGLRTVAEFVESDAILDKLRAVGVDYAQGYAIHRPAPLAADPAPQPGRKG